MKQPAEAQTVFDLVASLLFLIIVLVNIENPVYCNIVNNDIIFISLKGLLQIAMGLIGVTTPCTCNIVYVLSVNVMLQIHLMYVTSQSVNLFTPSVTIRQR